jgi:hypothetical protein
MPWSHGQAARSFEWNSLSKWQEGQAYADTHKPLKYQDETCEGRTLSAAG